MKTKALKKRHSGSSLKKGNKFVCVPCGKEVVVGCCGYEESTLYCCGQPMTKKSGSAPLKKSAKKKG